MLPCSSWVSLAALAEWSHKASLLGAFLPLLGPWGLLQDHRPVRSQPRCGPRTLAPPPTLRCPSGGDGSRLGLGVPGGCGGRRKRRKVVGGVLAGRNLGRGAEGSLLLPGSSAAEMN